MNTLTMHDILYKKPTETNKFKPKKQSKYSMEKKHLISKIVHILLEEPAHVNISDLSDFLRKIDKD